jgi:hypothetical protein
MKKSFYSLPGLLLMMALSGCCANNVCNCDDTLADALYFKFRYTKRRQPNAFTAGDIDTLRIYRTNRRPRNPSDTIGFVSTTDVVTIARRLDFTSSPGDTLIDDDYFNSVGTRLRNQDLIVINNTSPFASTGSTKLSAYNYRIAVVRNKVEIANYYILRPQLNGRFDANGCCTCYQNFGKAYTLATRRLADSVQIKDAADSAGHPKVVRLRY